MLIAVTGATGSVGRHVLDQLLERGQQVRAVSRDPAVARLPAGVQPWRALTEDGHAGARYTLSGPEVLTKVEQACAIGAGLGREVRFEEITPQEWRAALGPELPEAVAEFLLARWAAASVDPEPVLPTVQEVIGRPPRSLARWAADHAEDFGGARR